MNVPSPAQGTISKIDQLSTVQDVEKFIQSRYKDLQNFRIKNISEMDRLMGDKSFCKKVADSLKVDKNFYKADFDNNGRTDLLVVGDYYGFIILTVMDFGNDSLLLQRLTRSSFQDCVFPKIIAKENTTLIDYYYQPDKWGYTNGVGKKPEYLVRKTLVYKFGDFVEYNEIPKNYQIEKIEYKTTPCFGTCPIFGLKIENDRKGEYQAGNYNVEQFKITTKKTREIKGDFYTEIDSVKYNQLIELLNYIDFPVLDNKYAVGWTDDQSCTLTITYNNGKVKQIEDYGLTGTFGLTRLYHLLFELRFNQNWKKTINE